MNYFTLSEYSTEKESWYLELQGLKQRMWVEGAKAEGGCVEDFEIPRDSSSVDLEDEKAGGSGKERGGCVVRGPSA